MAAVPVSRIHGGRGSCLVPRGRAAFPQSQPSIPNHIYQGGARDADSAPERFRKTGNPDPTPGIAAKMS